MIQRAMRLNLEEQEKRIEVNSDMVPIIEMPVQTGLKMAKVIIGKTIQISGPKNWVQNLCAMISTVKPKLGIFLYRCDTMSTEDGEVKVEACSRHGIHPPSKIFEHSINDLLDAVTVNPMIGSIGTSLISIHVSRLNELIAIAKSIMNKLILHINTIQSQETVKIFNILTSTPVRDLDGVISLSDTRHSNKVKENKVIFPPSSLYFTSEQIIELRRLSDMGDATAIAEYKKECFEKNPPITTKEDKEEKEITKPNDITAGSHYVTSIGTVLTPSAVPVFVHFNLFPVTSGAEFNEYEIDLTVIAQFTGQYDQALSDIAFWIDNTPNNTTIPGYLNYNGTTESSNLCLLGFRTLQALSTSTPMITIKKKKMQNGGPYNGFYSTMYAHFYIVTPVNTGATTLGVTGMIDLKGVVQKDTRLTAVDMVSQLTDLRVNVGGSIPINVNVQNSPLVVDIDNTPLPVQISNSSIPVTVTGNVDTTIKGIAFTNDIQVSTVFTQNVGSNEVWEERVVTPQIKYDHTGKEPNDKDFCYNMFNILRTLPDSYVDSLLEDDDNDIGPSAKAIQSVNEKELVNGTIEEKEAGKVRSGKAINMKKKDKEEKKITDPNKISNKEFNGIVDSMNNAGIKSTKLNNTEASTQIDNANKSSEKDRLTGLYNAALQRSISIKKKSNNQHSRIKQFCKYYISFYETEGNALKTISKFYLKRLLYLLDLDKIIPLVEGAMTFGELSFLCLVILLVIDCDPDNDAMFMDEVQTWGAGRSLGNFCVREDFPIGQKLFEEVNAALLGEKVVKYSHMGKEPNDTNYDESDLVMDNNEVNVEEVQMQPELLDYYPKDISETHQFLSDRAQLELFALREIAKELGKDFVSVNEANDFIKAGAREANFIDKLITSIANYGDFSSNRYLGPGYTGGSFDSINNLTELAERFVTRPGSDLDAVARIHDLMRTLHTTPYGQERADQKMLDLIDSMKDSNLQSTASRFVIKNLAIPYAKHIMHVEPPPLAEEIKIFETPLLLSDKPPTSTILLKTPEQMTFEEFMQDRRNRRMGPTNREMHAMNGNTVSADKLKKMIVRWVDKFTSNHDDSKSIFGYVAGLSQNALNNADFIYWLNYLRYRSASSTQKLIYISFETQQPVDGYTSIPTIVGFIFPMGINLDPVSAVGPDLVAGPLAGMFEKADEEDLTKVISAMRTNTAITSATTNLGIWAMTRDATGNAHMIGSNSMMLAKLWLLLDQMCATSEFSPIWNNADDKYMVIGNNNPVQNPTYFPNYGIPNIVLRYWAMTQQQYISLNFLSTNIQVLNFTLSKAIFVLITQELLDPSNINALWLLLTTKLPFPLLNFSKTCNYFTTTLDQAANNLQTTTNAARIDHFKRIPETDGAVRYFNVVFVVAGFTGTTQNNGWDFDFTVPILGGVSTQANNPTRNLGVPVVDDGVVPNSLGPALRAMSILTSGGASRVVERFWSEYYGSKDELARAFYLYSLVKFRFVKVPCLHTSCDQMVAGNNIDGAIANRGGATYLQGQANTNNGHDTSFQFHDMFGVRSRDQSQTSPGYLYSEMSVKYQLALITQIRKITTDKLSTNGVPPLQPEQRFIYGLEVSSCFAMIYSKTLAEIGIPRTQYYSYETVNVGPNQEIEMQDEMLRRMCEVMDCGNFVQRKSIPWNVGMNTQGTVYDSYSVTPIVQELSFTGCEAWEKEEQSDMRDCSAIISATDMMASNAWQKSVLGVLAALANFGHHGDNFVFDIQKFLKLWQPNIVLLGIDTTFNSYALSGNRRIYLGNLNTKKAFKIMNPTILPSGRNHYRQITDHIPGGFAAVTDIKKMHVYPALTYIYPPDTGSDKFKMNVVVSPEMVNLLLNGSLRLFQSNNCNTISVQLYPSMTITTNPSSLSSFLRQDKKEPVETTDDVVKK